MTEVGHVNLSSLYELWRAQQLPFAQVRWAILMASGTAKLYFNISYTNPYLVDANASAKRPLKEEIVAQITPPQQ